MHNLTLDKVTAKELTVIRQIAENYLGPTNGRPKHVDDCQTYSDCIADQHAIPNSVSGKALSGVVSSLVQKGLAGTAGRGRDEYTFLTPQGFDLWKLQRDAA